MSHISKSALTPFAAERMYQLVNDVTRYSEFLPWCGHSALVAQNEQEIVAQVTVNVKGVKKSFTTRNRLTPHSRIDISLVEGPFSSLTGFWAFQALTDEACKVSLTLDFHFANKLLSLTIGPIFSHIADTMVDAFCQRAQDLYTKAD